MDLAVDVALAALVFVALGLVITPRVRAWLDQDMTAVAGTFAITAIAGLLMLRAYGDAASRGSGKPLLLLGLAMLLISLGAAVVLIHLVRRELVSRRAHQERSRVTAENGHLASTRRSPVLSLDPPMILEAERVGA